MSTGAPAVQTGAVGVPAYVCTNTGAESPFGPPDPELPCCWASADSPDRCSCWLPIHSDAELEGLIARSNELAEGPPAVRAQMCGDCAYRPGSPERADNDGGQLDYTVTQRFYCHQGMPLIVAWWHPSGEYRMVPEPKGDYDPVMRGDRAWQADGSPAVLCAGWAARNRVPRRRADG